MYATSDVSSGFNHSHTEFPALFAGKAGGKLRGDVHVRANGESYSTALVTVTQAMGLALDGVGVAEGRATSGIGALLV